MAENWEEALKDIVARGSISDALQQFQLLEMVLKLYLQDVAWVVNRVRPAGIPFHLKPNALDKIPLGKLVSLFERHCDDPALVANLRAIVSERNHIAHQAFLELNKAAKTDLAAAQQATKARADAAKTAARTYSLEILAKLRVIRKSVPEADWSPDWT